MKKLFLMLLAAGTFALVSCGGEQQENAENQEQPAIEETQPVEEAPVEEAPEVEEEEGEAQEGEAQTQPME